MSSVSAIPSKQRGRRVPVDSELVVMHRGELVECHILGGKRTIIGRSPDATLSIRNRYVSWKHAILDFDDTGAFIVDLCSRNKTLVNGEEVLRTGKTRLRNGDVISIGHHRLNYQERPRNEKIRRSGNIPVDTSVDTFRSYAELVGNDPDMVAAELGTIDMDIDESPVDSLSTQADATEGQMEREAKRIGKIGSAARVEAAAVSKEELEAAIERFSKEPGSLIELLGEEFQDRAIELSNALCDLLGFRAMSNQRLMALTPAFDQLDLATSRSRKCVLVDVAGQPTAIFCDPFDENLRPWVESRIPETLEWVLVSPGDLSALIARYEQSMRAMDSALPGAGVVQEDDLELEDLSLASISMDSSPVVKLVHSTLYDALRAGASDIHMEAGNSALEIRYRIDGVLAHVASVNGREIAEQVISRIKVMSELDIAERRIPQDGRFKSSYDGRPIDFRVSIMPSSYGEDAVLRVLDKQAVTDQLSELSLDSLGFASPIVNSLRKLSERPYGMLLVTGPTGSGKTTTLYGAISETNSGLGKIVTIEDPVEYQLPGVLQIPVNEKKGLTFARGLRSILRHDPDKIMVGEIRDPETAQIAIQSALTGHLVFTTVHANNVFDVLSRFLHMGVDAYSFVSALNGILAQRLLRIVCQHCGEEVRPTEAMLLATGEDKSIASSYKWRAGRGCSECRGTGYRGRKAVGELLVLDDEIREAIIGRAPVRQLKEMAQASGVEFIRTAALNLVRDGLTTIEEVDRVTTMA